MKKYLLMMSFTMIASLFLFTSCQKEEMDEDEYEDVMAADTMMAVALGFRNSDTLVTDYPLLIDEYLAANYPNTELLGVTTDGKEYEAELAGGITLIFNLDGNFLMEELPELEAEDTDSIITEWPAAIDEYIALNYPNDTIGEVEFEDGEYEIELLSGIELIFDLDGNFLAEELDNDEELTEWPAAIDEYIASNYPDAQIEEIELNNKEYEVELDNGVELLFDLDGNFLAEAMEEVGLPADTTGTTGG